MNPTANLSNVNAQPHLSIPISTRGGTVENIYINGPFPLTRAEWDQFLAVLTAMAPALVEEDSSDESSTLISTDLPAPPPFLSQQWMNAQVAAVHEQAETITGPEIKVCTEHKFHEPHMYDEDSPYPLWCPGILTALSLTLDNGPKPAQYTQQCAQHQAHPRHEWRNPYAQKDSTPWTCLGISEAEVEATDEITARIDTYGGIANVKYLQTDAERAQADKKNQAEPVERMKARAPQGRRVETFEDGTVGIRDDSAPTLPTQACPRKDEHEQHVYGDVTWRSEVKDYHCPGISAAEVAEVQRLAAAMPEVSPEERSKNLHEMAKTMRETGTGVQNGARISRSKKELSPDTSAKKPVRAKSSVRAKKHGGWRVRLELAEQQLGASILGVPISEEDSAAEQQPEI